MFLQCFSKYETFLFFNNKEIFVYFTTSATYWNKKNFKLLPILKFGASVVIVGNFQIFCSWGNGGDCQNIQGCLKLKINKGYIQKCGEQLQLQ